MTAVPEFASALFAVPDSLVVCHELWTYRATRRPLEVCHATTAPLLAHPTETTEVSLVPRLPRVLKVHFPPWETARRAVLVV